MQTELAEYIQSNILPDYDNFVKAGEQYNNDAVHINDIVGNFNKMSFELKQSTEHIMDYISNITRCGKRRLRWYQPCGIQHLGTFKRYKYYFKAGSTE